MRQTIQRADMPGTDLDGDLLMLNVERGLYHWIQGAGPRIWELLAEPTTERAVVERLMTEFDVPLEVCSAEVAEFVAELRKLDLLVDAG